MRKKADQAALDGAIRHLTTRDVLLRQAVEGIRVSNVAPVSRGICHPGTDRGGPTAFDGCRCIHLGEGEISRGQHQCAQYCRRSRARFEIGRAECRESKNVACLGCCRSCEGIYLSGIGAPER